MTLTGARERAPLRLPRAPGLIVLGGGGILLAWILLPAGPVGAGLLLLLNAVTVAALAVGIRRYQPSGRPAWVVLLVTQICSLAAYGYWYLYPVVTGAVLAVPSPADALFFGLYAGNCLAVGLLLRGERGGDRRALLDVLIVTASLGALSWVFLMEPYAADAELSTLAKVVSLAYPAFDLVLVVLTLGLAFNGTRTTPAKALLLVWAALQLAADTLYGVQALMGTWTLANPAILLWMAALACLAAAAAHPSMATTGRPTASSERRTGQARLTVIVGIVLTLPTMLVVRLLQGRPDGLGVISIASLVVVVLALSRGAGTGGARPTVRDRRALVRLVAAFTVGALLPLALLAGTSIRLSERAVEGDARARVRTTSTVSAQLVQHKLEGLGQLVAAYAERQLLSESLGDGTLETFDRDAVRRHMAQLWAAGPEIAGVLVTDASGRLGDSLPATPEIVGTDVSYRDWYRGATSDEGPYVSRAYATAIRGEARVVAASVAVRHPETGELVGVLAVIYDLRTLQRFAEELSVVQDVRLRITDQNGTVVAEPGEDAGDLADASRDPGVAAALTGEESLSTVVDDAGEEVLSASAPVEGLGWTVTAQVPTATAYASLDQLRSTVLGIAVLLGQVLLGGLVLLARTQRQRREAQRDLVDARDEAVTASRVKSEFLAVMSHELRTPMNGVMGMTSLLLATPLSARQREYADTVRRSADDLLALLNDVLDLSKVEARRLELEVVDFTLQTVVRDVVHLQRGLAIERGITLEASIDDDVPLRLRGDAGRLRQVLLNLVSNAVKFTEAGSVTVRFTSDQSASAGQGAVDGVAIRCEVVDTGIGIHPAAQQHVFDAFSQADASTTRRYGGTGLGLAISKQLVALFDGEIGVHSVVGEGSTFWFTATFAAAAAPERAAEGAFVPAAPARSGLVLVVDDNATNQKIAVRMLEALGHRADVAANGLEATTACAQVPYDLVLMDCQMPVMDGYEATRRIRAADPGGRRTPIVAMTASAMAADRQRCLDAGMDTYLSKPVRLVDLAEVVDRWLGDRTPLPEPAHPAADDRLDHGPVLDPQVLSGLESLGRQFLADLVPVFVEAAPRGLADVRAAVQDGDADALSAAAHALRGSAGNMGGVRVAAVCRRLERAGAAGELTGAHGDLLVLETEMALMLAAVAEITSAAP